MNKCLQGTINRIEYLLLDSMASMHAICAPWCYFISAVEIYFSGPYLQV
jgi:hypothetical protein